jgi:hypothetical protein
MGGLCMNKQLIDELLFEIIEKLCWIKGLTEEEE